LVPFLRLNASQLSDFGRPRASPCNDTPYESEITTARLKLKSPYEQVFEQMELGGKRSDFRGEPEVLDAIEYEPEQIELEAHTDEPLDVEVLDDDGQPFTPDEPEHGLEDDSEPPSPFAPRNPPPEAALLPFDAAVSAAAAMRRSVVSHRATRR
jgi:hypothetical protein